MSGDELTKLVNEVFADTYLCWTQDHGNIRPFTQDEFQAFSECISYLRAQNPMTFQTNFDPGFEVVSSSKQGDLDVTELRGDSKRPTALNQIFTRGYFIQRAQARRYIFLR